MWLCVDQIHCTLYVWLCGCQSDMLGFGGRVAVSLMCWALSLYGCQSDMLGFGGRVAVSLICWALSLYGCQSDMLGFVAVWLSV